MRGKLLHRTIGITIAMILCTSVHVYAQSWWFGKNKVQYKQFEWAVLKTPHFDIHFSEGYRDLAARTAIILEYGYEKLSGDFGHHLSWRVPVILYGSHADFQQTNVTWELLPEGVQAFAEPLRKRMVLHYGGSNTDYTHTTIHELVHIFTYDMVYGSLLRSAFSRSLLFAIPLWFAEGLAEYYSVGYDEEGEMFMRDATVFDYLSDLDYTYGYMVYKSGQSAVYYINDTYGPGKVLEIMDHLRHQRSMELALQATLGLSTKELSRDWKKSMRQKYWPLYSDKAEAEEYGRKLTDHVKHHHYQNTKPVFSPDGEYIVYFSDLKGLDGIYLLNALTGKVEKKLVSGQMSSQFESIRTMKSRLTYSPDGTKVAFVSMSHGRDRLNIMEVPQGKIIKEIDLPLDFFYSPSWSPDGERFVLVGSQGGQTDLYIYHLEEKQLIRLTDDIGDEEDPAWFPDGGRIAYVRYADNVIHAEFAPDSAGIERLNGIDYRSRSNVSNVNGDIWGLDIETGEQELLIATSGDDKSPIIISGGKEIIFTSNEDVVTNLYRGSLEVGSYHRFTDVLGGIFSPTYSAGKDRLAFTAFNTAGYDIFVMDSFSEKSRMSYSTGRSFMATGEEAIGGEGPGAEASVADTVGAAVARKGTARALTGVEGLTPEEEDIELSGSAEVWQTGERPGDIRDPGPGPFEISDAPEVVVDEDSDPEIHPDTLEALRARMEGMVGTVQPYRVRFSPDYIGNGLGLFFSTGFGFGMANEIGFSDLLGDHHLFFSFNIYRSLEDSDFMVRYYYLKNRINYSVGIFQYKNFLNSRVSSVGEYFLDYRLFTERNYGLYALASFPFSMFTRFDLEFQGYISEREFFDYRVLDPDVPGGFTYVPGERSRRRLFQPTLSLVHDSAYFGSFGPVIGSRWHLSFSRALSFSGRDLSRTAAFFDYRRYFNVFYRNYFALRTMGAVSTGEDYRVFFLGGPTTMRGYDYLQFSGSRMMLLNLEYRYPLVDALVFGWPGRWGLRNIGGTVFLDAGAVWGPGTFIEQVPPGIDYRSINDVWFWSDFGIGFYMRLGYFILNFQLAWPTDYSDTGRAMFHFYIGPQF